MNSAMPYRSCRSQSRVEFIKKKFENSFSENGDCGSSDSSFPHKPNFIKELQELNLNKKASDVKYTSNCDDRNANKVDGKALVKRSPAFRRDKLASTKSLTSIQDSHSNSLSKSDSKNSETSCLNNAKTEDSVLFDSLKDFKRSKTDTNLLKHCSNRTQESPHNLREDFKDSDNSEATGENGSSEGDRNAIVSTQYSVVNKKKNPSENTSVSLCLSESIRRALQSPLPKGPPPKKPPRTFCHVPSTKESSTSSNISCKNDTIPPEKTDIPCLKSKLDKLEKVIKIHEIGGKTENLKSFKEKPEKETENAIESSSVCDGTETNFCFPSSKCLNLSYKFHNFKTLPQTKSEFYLDAQTPDSNSAHFKHVELIGGRSLLKKCDSETIYDLPSTSKEIKKSFETFGKTSKDLKESANAKRAEGLHYMCTDVINQSLKYPNFTCKGNLSETQMSSFKTKTELVACTENQLNNNLKMRRNNGKSFLSKGEPEEGSEDSEQDSVSGNSLDCDEVKRGSEKEMLSQTTANRKIYVSRVSSKLMNQVPCWNYKNKNSYNHLFECCLLVGLTLCESKKNVPYVKSVFPPQIKPPPMIESLCFPDASFWPSKSENHHPEEQCYSLVVTNENGERKFGYCRRVLPEGGYVCLPLAYCIISPHRAAGFFYKVLEELESRHGSPGLDNFIKQLYESEFPGPGERLKLKEILEEATKTNQLDSDAYLSSTLVRRPPDLRLEEKDLTQLFQHIELSVFFKIFSSLLHERKVLLLSSSLRNLSSCTESLHSILVPFSWQYTYIPVLPAHLIELCEAPTPYVMGMLKSGNNLDKTLAAIAFQDGIIVDLDDSKVVKCCGDEGTILPSRSLRNLKTSLNLATNATELLSENVRSVLISDAFIRFFVQLCGHCFKFINTLPSGDKIFQKQEFIKSVPSNTNQSFLEWFTETAMFNCFIEERLQEDDDEDMLVQLFKRRAMEFSETSLKDSAVLFRNYRVINKKVRTLGDRIKDLTTFNK